MGVLTWLQMVKFNMTKLNRNGWHRFCGTLRCGVIIIICYVQMLLESKLFCVGIVVATKQNYVYEHITERRTQLYKDLHVTS